MKRIYLFAIAILFIIIGVFFNDGFDFSHSQPKKETVPSQISPPPSTKEDAIILVPGGGLIAHEKAGGHLIARHVGRTEQQLMDRVNSGAVRTASSFYDLNTAERVVAQTISVNQPKIARYLNTNQHKYLEISYRSPSPVGYSFTYGGHSVKTARGVKVIISQDKTMPIKYRIVTGYPTP